MRLLFEIDKNNYQPDGEVFRRPSARAIIMQDGKIAMIYSRKNGYYKLPGGGIEPDESIVDAMIREVFEETGLTVIPESIQEYGYVHRIEKGRHEPVFIQDNYYFLCRVEASVQAPTLTESELEEDFVLQYVTPEAAIRANLNADLGEARASMVLRENRVLEMVIEEILNQA